MRNYTSYNQDLQKLNVVHQMMKENGKITYPANLFCIGPQSKFFGFARHIVSEATTQICLRSWKAA